MIEIDLSDVRRACNEGNAQQLRVARSAPLDAAREGQAQALGRRRYKDRTGGLTGRAFAALVATTETGSEAEMRWPVPYASFVDAGTAPHEISPRRRTYLKFGGSGGNPVFARSVRHPGTRPTGFAGDAAQTAERLLVRDVEVGFRELEQILNR